MMHEMNIHRLIYLTRFIIISRYRPTLLVLGPGDHIHINKQSLHIFRKCSLYEDLSEDDCFFELRNETKRNVPSAEWNDRCVSTAWDWVFMGGSSLGMARELSTSLRAHFELSHYQRDNDGNCQAIGKVMHQTLSMAGALFDRYNSRGDRESIDLEAIRAIQPILAVAKL